MRSLQQRPYLVLASFPVLCYNIYAQSIYSMPNLRQMRIKMAGILPSWRFWFVNQKRKQALVLILVSGIVAFLVLSKPAMAAGDWKEYIWGALAYILEAVANLEVKLLLWVIHYIIVLSGYNNFLNARVVSVGWALVRDVANMFFILVMLIIAFGTMLNLEQYSWKKLLPRLLITAVLVNFSKTIIGLLIDFGQVIMLTFVNGYAAAAGGNFVQMFGLDKMFEVSTEGVSLGSSVSFEALGGFLLGVILLGVALIVTAVFVAILMFRIITLWILIVLSPLAFMLGTFPKGQQYYADWWKKLTNNIIVGPLLAFFLWLSLAAMGGSDQNTQLMENNALPTDITSNKTEEKPLTEMANWENLGSFAVSIAMLFIALQMTQELGATGAGLASGAAGWMKKTGTDALKKYGLRYGLPAAVGMFGLPPVGAAVGLAATRMIGKKADSVYRKGTYWMGDKLLGAAGRLPVVGSDARDARAALRQARFKPAQEAAKNVDKMPKDDLIREAGRRVLPVTTDEDKEKIFQAQSKILKDPKLSAEMREKDSKGFGRMVGNFRNLGDSTGNLEKANDVLKTFYKNNPHLVTDKQGQTNTPERKTEVKKTLEGQSLQQVLDMDPDAFNDDDVFNQFDHARYGSQVMEKGSEKLRKGYSKAMMQKRFNLADDEFNNPNTHQPDIQTKVGDRLPEVPEGALPPEIFRALNNDQQVDSLKLKKITVDRLEATDLTNDQGRLAGGIANSDSPELIQSAITYKRADMEQGLRNFEAAIPLAGVTIDPTNPTTAAQIATRSAEMKQKLRRQDPDVKSGKEVDQMLKNNGITPDITIGSPADLFMDDWIKNQVIGQMEQERVSEQKARAKAVLTGMQGAPARVYNQLGYDDAAGDWQGTPVEKQEHQAMAAKMAGTDEIASVLKNLKVEAIVKKDAAGNITGLTQLGNTLTQNMRVSTLMRFAQEHQTAALRGLSAALIAGKHLRGSATEKKQIEDRKKSPAFNQIDWEDMVSKLKDTIKE